MTPAGAEPIAKRNIFVNAHFRIEPCASCPIPGYLIVSPRVPVSSLAELSPDAEAALGATLVAAIRAVEAVVHPQRVYCALFAEETRSVHFTCFLDPNGRSPRIPVLTQKIPRYLASGSWTGHAERFRIQLPAWTAMRLLKTFEPGSRRA